MTYWLFCDGVKLTIFVKISSKTTGKPWRQIQGEIIPKQAVFLYHVSFLSPLLLVFWYLRWCLCDMCGAWAMYRLPMAVWAASVDGGAWGPWEGTRSSLGLRHCRLKIKQMHVFQMVLLGPFHLPLALSEATWQGRTLQNGHVGQI